LKELYIQARGREKRWIYKKDGEIEGLFTYQPHQESLVGNIYLGKVTKVERGLGAAFVDIGEGRNGYLAEKDIPQNVEAYLQKQQSIPIHRCVHEGEKLLVQVTKDASETKGPRLTAVIEFSTENLVYMPHGHYIAVSKKINDMELRKTLKRLGYNWKSDEEGMIFRTSAAFLSEDVLHKEFLSLKTQFAQFASNGNKKKAPAILYETNSFFNDVLKYIKKGDTGDVYCDDFETLKMIKAALEQEKLEKWKFHHFHHSGDIFQHYQLDGYWERLLRKIVWLDNGAFIVIEGTEAMTVIDVNSGKFTGKENLGQTIRKTNVLAAKEIAKQLKLRNISGMIIIDFIDMKKESDKAEVIKALAKELKADEQRTVIVGYTELGLLQLTRKRSRKPLLDYLTDVCPVCSGVGRTLSTESIAFQLERELWEYEHTDATEIIVEATVDVKKVFVGEGNHHLHRLEKILMKKIKFQINNHSHPYFHIRRIN
jgi:ribonuclease G